MRRATIMANEDPDDNEKGKQTFQGFQENDFESKMMFENYKHFFCYFSAVKLSFFIRL